MKIINLLSYAQEFATKAHQPIFRKTVSGAKIPHIIHIQEVADLVYASGGTEIEVIAAWLHDTVEDTAITMQDIETEFGKEIVEIVHGLTDLDEIKNLPTTERKSKQAHRVRTESLSVRRIKLADQTSNVKFIANDPAETWTNEGCKAYIEGARLIAEECRGISPLLEKLFDEAYQNAVKRFGSVKK